MAKSAYPGGIGTSGLDARLRSSILVSVDGERDLGYAPAIEVASCVVSGDRRGDGCSLDHTLRADLGPSRWTSLSQSGPNEVELRAPAADGD
jgi:hypothetical protein